ncbi:MAG TPA: SIS domain-containing protein [Streptosporangiaceae bacterium]|nr:SIS domain-containing protein [Streptosporangiaceae bacterium]
MSELDGRVNSGRDLAGLDADVAAARLDDPELIEAADPGGMLRQVASSAAQVRTAVRTCTECDLSALAGPDRPRAIVVVGMGGSGIAGDVLAAACGNGCPAQIVTSHGYHLPGWVGASDLVIAVSCSGSTEETLGAATEAVRRGCQLVCVGGAGSPLESIAVQAQAPFVPVVSAGMPRSTLWGLSIPLIAIAERIGIMDVGPDAYEATAAALERISYQCRPTSESFINPGKSLALDLLGTLPMIWGSTALGGVVAKRFAAQLNENAKYPGIAGELPEANHNQVVAFDGPFAPGSTGADAGSGFPLRLVLVTDSGEHPQVARRRETSAELASERGIGVSELPMEGDHALERFASVVQLIDYATVYLGIASGVDPTPIAIIQDLKERIA